MPSSAKDICLDALDLPTAERADFVAQKCEGDAALLKQVSDLLAADASAKFIDKASMAMGMDWAQPKEKPIGRSEQPGDVIEYYRLVRPIGEGGFGTVFLAQQEEPVVRQVALKVLKLGMNTEEIVRRFEGEQQTLAVMDHPNIARVYDAGATDAGRPYFVMEYVDGPSITDYATKHMLGVRERLELFEQVCLAIQHAHQKGVIHRDLKPSNILVTKVDGKPEPKVIDFGIAKATNPGNAFLPAMTREMQIVGTPQYMSPEQAAAGGAGSANVDTRSDVYSLGTVLYELMTGVPPFNPQTLRNAGLEKICQIIREETPSKPSTRLADSREEPAAQQVTTLTQVRQIAGEVDWIVMKALEKEPGRRYQSAADLAADIRNHLEDRAVLAGPPSRLYQVRKFARRHRPTIFAASLITVALIAATAVSLYSATAARRAEIRAVTGERQAVENKERAELELGRATAVRGFVSKMLGGVAPAVSKGRDTQLLRDMLAEASQNADRELKDQPIVNLAVRGIIAQAYEDLGDTEAALKQIEPAYQAIPPADKPEALRSDGMLMYARLLTLEDRRAEGLDLLDAMETALNAIGERNSVRAVSVRIARANTLEATGKYVQAEKVYQAELDAIRARGEIESDLGQNVLNSLAIVVGNQDRGNEAATMFEELLAIQSRTLGHDSAIRMITLSNLGSIYSQFGRNEEAVKVYAEILEVQRRYYPAGHIVLSKVLTNYGVALLNLKRNDEAAPLLEEAYRYESPGLMEARGVSFQVQQQMVRLRREQNRPDEAATLAFALKNAYASRRGEKDPNTLSVYPMIFACLTQAGRTGEVIAMAKELTDDGSADRMAAPQRMAFEAAAGLAYAKAGQTAEARRRADYAESLAGAPIEGRRGLSRYLIELRQVLGDPVPTLNLPVTTTQPATTRQ